MSPHALDLRLQTLDASPDQTAVSLKLGLAGASGADSAAKALEVGPSPGQTGQQVLLLGKLDLHTPFMGASAAGEYVQDEGGPVDDFDAKSTLQIALLGRREFVVEDGHVVPDAVAQRYHLVELSAADEVCGCRRIQALCGRGNDLGSSGARELTELGQRLLE